MQRGKQYIQAYIVQHALEVALCSDKGRDCAVVAAEAHIGTSCIADEGRVKASTWVEGIQAPNSRI